MKALKPRARPSAEEALRAVASHAPSLPPVQLAEIQDAAEHRLSNHC